MNDKTQTLRNFTSDCYTVNYAVQEKDDGIRIDQFILNQVSSFSREFVKKKLAKGEIQIEGREASLKPSTRVKKWQRVIMTTHRSHIEDEYWRGELIEFDPVRTLYEDDSVIAISKPAFMTAHPTGKHLFHTATVYVEQLINSTVHLPHRLDRETSGVLLLTKNAEVANDLSKAFASSKVKKCYLLIANKQKERSLFPFVAHDRLGQVDGDTLFMQSFPEDSNQGKKSETAFDLIFEDDKYALALAFPRTGRQHQIRAHAAHHGYPLLGDKTYHGGVPMFKRFKDQIATEEDHDLMQIPRQALHALALLFPLGKEVKIVKDTLPLDLLRWCEENFKDFSLEECEKTIQSKIDSYFNDFKKLITP